MVDVVRLEGLGRAIMSASVEAEYLGLSGIVCYLDGAFADVVRIVADQQRHAVAMKEQEDLDSVERGGSGG